MIAFLKKLLEAGKANGKKLNEGSLTPSEKKLVKKLLKLGYRGQDVQYVINLGRKGTVNSGRVSGVNKDVAQEICTDEELAKFLREKQSVDLQTGLNPYKDERLVRSREAMILAVQVYNSATFQFKAELFPVLANIAWTYICHQRLLQLGKGIHNEDGKTLALSEMVGKPVLGLSIPVQENLKDLKKLRDKVEHSLLEKSDVLWLGLFQACCMNFDKVMCDWFGEELSLTKDLSFSLQFAKPDLDQMAGLMKYDIPADIAAFNAELKADKPQDVLDSVDYAFTVHFSFEPASKSKAHVQFVSADSSDGKEVSTVLVKTKSGDDLYPYKPAQVAKLVAEKSGQKFTVNDHSKAWKKHKVRPSNVSSASAKNVNKQFCLYHKAHKDFTYNDAWFDKLVEETK